MRQQTFFRIVLCILNLLVVQGLLRGPTTADHDARIRSNIRRKLGEPILAGMMMMSNGGGSSKKGKDEKITCPEGGTERFDFLNETFWIVPDEGVPSYQLDVTNGQVSYSQDQTVWKITGYDYAYFWGTITKVFSQVDPTTGEVTITSTACTNMLSSITPKCDVLITGINENAQRALFPNQGPGIVEYDDETNAWTFTMQMGSGNFGEFVAAHWSPMVQCKPTDDCWTNLPGINIGVEEVLSFCGLTPEF